MQAAASPLTNTSAPATGPSINSIMNMPSDQPAYDLNLANRNLENASPAEIIRYALQHSKRPMISTSFGAHSAALLHMVVSQRPDINVVWADSGYNTSATYRFADKLITDLQLNIKIYVPSISAAHLNARNRGIPDAETDAHKEFSRIVKIEPFNQAFGELKPDLWLNGMRKEETEFRKKQSVFTFDKSRNTTKVAPLFKLSEAEVESYIAAHGLPMEHDYFDPTKVAPNQECGLHTYVI
ncbi:MAG: phosphoadenosine phosphosulfate reductase family protein [Pseudomonadales bacterium]|nr:phosphoadenosine phosphosulfate reductase family protein [Pseudomonadales bacterium]